MMAQNHSRRSTASSFNIQHELTASARKRNNSASIVTMTKTTANKRAFGVDVSNARKELNAAFNAGGGVGYKKNNIENVKPTTGAENVKGFNAPAVRPATTAPIASKTQQVPLNAVSGFVATATYPVNIAQVARPRALSKRAINTTVFRDEENLDNVLPSVETQGAPAPIDNQASILVADDLSPALARLSVSPGVSGSPSQQAIPTADGGSEVWDSDISDESESGYRLAEYHAIMSGRLPLVHIPCGLYDGPTARMLEVAAAYVNADFNEKDAKDDYEDITMAMEYADEIFAFIKEVELKNIVSDNYMEAFQTEVKPDMRRVLMDWIVQVHQRFNMLPETLYLCVNYIDRFLSAKVVSLGKLQLVGATALLLAAKVEEVNAPTVPEMVYMVDDTYGFDEVLKAERFMLEKLNWEMQFPGPMSFLRRISKADDYDIEVRTLAKYVLEVLLMDYRFVSVPPSFAAAGAVCLSRFLLNKGPWTTAHVHYSGYTGDQLNNFCHLILDALRQDPKMHHKSVYEKYSSTRYNQYALKVEAIIFGTEHKEPFLLPMVLGDNQIFDYEENVHGCLAGHRANELIKLGLYSHDMTNHKEVFLKAQATEAMMRRREARRQARQAQFTSMVPTACSAFNPYAVQYKDEVLA